MAVVCALCLLAGCGGSSSKTKSSQTVSGQARSERPTRTAYLSSANTICRAARTKTSALIAQLEGATANAVKAPSATTVEPLVKLIAHLQDTASATIAELRSLPRPEGSQTSIEAFFSPLSEAVASLGKARSAISSGHAQQAIGTLLSLQSLTSTLASAAHAAGMTECAGVLSVGATTG